jgi:DNA-directed RNA polymerase subunit RPC12/RpoP
MIPVRCPHCGAGFAFDPRKETVVAWGSPDAVPMLPAMVYRPDCTTCDRVVTVRLSGDPWR